MADYATITELKARIDKEHTDDDTILTAIITGASRAIDNYCNRPDGFVALTSAAARVYGGSGNAIQSIDECVEVTAVAVKDSVTDSTYTAWAASDWIAFSGDPEDPDFNGLPYTYLMADANGDYSVFTSGYLGGYANQDYYFNNANSPRYHHNPRTARRQATVQVTAKWGYSVTVPAPIKEACCMQSARWYKRYASAFSDVLASGELGQLFYRQALDPDIGMILVDGRYVKPAVGRR